MSQINKKFLLLFSLSLLILPRISQAGFLDNVTCIKDPKVACGLDDIFTGFKFLTQLLLGAIGAIALLYFIWGGLQWITSSGNPERVNKGRAIMTNTVFALLVAFSSYLLVSFIINDLLGAKPEYRIEDECAGKSRGTRCNNYQINYVCTGANTFTGEWANYNELCVSKCALKNLQYHSISVNVDGQTIYPLADDYSWVCMDKPNNDESIIFETNLCPGDVDHVCILVDGHGLPVIQ